MFYACRPLAGQEIEEWLEVQHECGIHEGYCVSGNCGALGNGGHGLCLVHFYEHIRHSLA